MTSPRALKVGEEIKRTLSSIFHENIFWDIRLREAAITITEVRMSSDLKTARIFFLPFGKPCTEPVLKALREESPRIRKLLASEIQLRTVPEIYFHLDTSYENFKQVDTLLNDPKVQKDLLPDSSSAEEDS